MKAAAIAHADCVKAGAANGSDIKTLCAKTRDAYAAYLPQEVAGLEISILEHKVITPTQL